MSHPVKHDELELDYGGSSQTFRVRRGSFRLENGAVSWVLYDDPPTVRAYVPLGVLARFLYRDLSDARL